MDVLVHFAQDVVELTRSDIALHLLIPFVVFPAMEPGREFGPLFKRKLFDGGLDLVNAHGLNDMQECLSPQRATGNDTVREVNCGIYADRVGSDVCHGNPAPDRLPFSNPTAMSRSACWMERSNSGVNGN